MTGKTPGVVVEILDFDLAGGRYGVALHSVREILRAVAMARLPGAPRVIKGIVNVRGSLVPVLSLRRRFELPERELEPSDHLVVVEARGRIVALHVDRARGIVRVDPAEIEDPRATVPRAEYVSGVAKLPDGMVLIHDLHTFLSEAESQALDGALSGTRNEVNTTA